MNPVLKRILVHGGATAALLAIVGLLFTQVAGFWLSSTGRAGPAEAHTSVSESLRYRVPLMMAFWGFLFVAVTELVLSRLRGPVPVKTATATPPDDAEKLLNELLAQAEAKMAAEAAAKADGQKTEDRGQEAEKKPEAEPSSPSPG